MTAMRNFLPRVRSSPPPSHAGGLPTSAIIGIAVGSVLAVVLAGAALAAALLRRPRHAGPAPAPPPSLQPGCVTEYTWTFAARCRD